MEAPANSATQGAQTSDQQQVPAWNPPPAYQPAPPPPPPQQQQPQDRREIRISLDSRSLVRFSVVCLCAIGLFAALIAPWVHMEMTVGTETETASYDGRLQRMDTPKEDDGMPSNLASALSDAGYRDLGGYYTRGIAITGLIVLLIVMGAAMFLRTIDVLPPRLGRVAQIALVGVGLLPASMAAVSGLRFVGGFGIAFDSLSNSMGAKVEISTLGGTVVAAIALVAVALLVFDLLKEISAARAASNPATSPLLGTYAHKLVLAIAVLAVAGIVLVPVTPWARYVPEESQDIDPFFQDEGLIHGQARSSGTASAEATVMDRDARYASAFFWLALVFSVVAMMAFALEGLRAPKAAVTGVRFASAMGFLFPLLGLLSFVGFMGALKDTEIALAAGELQFMAYAPLIIAFVLLLSALVYLAVVAKGMRGARVPAPAAGPAGDDARKG